MGRPGQRALALLLAVLLALAAWAWRVAASS